MTTKTQRRRKRQTGKKAPAKPRSRKPAKPAPEVSTLAVPVRGAELAWLAARLRDVARGWTRSPVLTLTVRREAVTAVLWDRYADLGVVASIDTTELVSAVDDLPARGLSVTLDLPAFHQLAAGLKREPTVTVDVCAGDASAEKVTLRTARAALRLKLCTSPDLTGAPLGASGPTARLDGRDLSKALGLAARFADPSHPAGEHVTLSLAEGSLSVLAGGEHRFGRLTVGAVDVTEPVEAAIPAPAAKAAHAVLRQATGEATLQASGDLITLTGATRHGSLGVILRRTAVPAVAQQVPGMFAKVDTRTPRLLAQLDARALGDALKRGKPLAPLANPGAPLTTVLTTDRAGRLLVGHVLGSRYQGDAGAVHVEQIDAWTTGRGTVAANPKLLAGLLPRRGPVVVDCGAPDEPIRVRVVDGTLSLDTVVMPYAPEDAHSWACRLRGEPEVFQGQEQGVA